MAHYRPLRPDDLPSVFALDLRQDDVDEIRAATGLDPEMGLLYSIAVSEHVWVVVHEGNIEGVFGVAYLNPGAQPWFVATDKFKEFRWAFAKESKKFVKRLLDDYGFLANYVSSKHEAAIRWLRWLGFTISEDEVFLHDEDVPFHYFYMCKEDEATCASRLGTSPQP